MTGPLVEFGDPERAIIDYLAGAYIGALAERKPTEFDVHPPVRTLVSGVSRLQVELDGTPIVEPMIERATIRCTYHVSPSTPDKRDAVKKGASLARGLVLSHPGDEVVWGTQPLVGRSRVLTDPDTSNLMVWFTIRANLRPLKVAI